MPDLQLPSQPHSITTIRPVPNYTAWWQRHMCVNNLCRVVTWKWNIESRTCVLLIAMQLQVRCLNHHTTTSHLLSAHIKPACYITCQSYSENIIHLKTGSNTDRCLFAQKAVGNTDCFWIVLWVVRSSFLSVADSVWLQEVKVKVWKVAFIRRQRRRRVVLLTMSQFIIIIIIIYNHFSMPN